MILQGLHPKHDIMLRALVRIDAEVSAQLRGI